MHVLGQGLAIESEKDVNIYFFPGLWRWCLAFLFDICFGCFVFAGIFKQKKPPSVLYKEKTLNVC